MSFKGFDHNNMDEAVFRTDSQQDNNYLQPFSWIRAIEGLARAIHQHSDHSMTLKGEENLARRIWIEEHDGNPNNLPQWISAASFQHVFPLGRHVAHTCGDIMLSLFQLSQPCELFVVCHNGSIIKAVSTASAEADDWCIIT